MKAWMSLNFHQIKLRTAELSALERLEKNIDLQWEKYCGHSSAFIFDWIFFNRVGNQSMHNSLDKFKI